MNKNFSPGIKNNRNQSPAFNKNIKRNYSPMDRINNRNISPGLEKNLKMANQKKIQQNINKKKI